jgi:signal transduction histidine kinase
MMSQRPGREPITLFATPPEMPGAVLRAWIEARYPEQSGVARRAEQRIDSDGSFGPTVLQHPDRPELDLVEARRDGARVRVERRGLEHEASDDLRYGATAWLTRALEDEIRVFRTGPDHRIAEASGQGREEGLLPSAERLVGRTFWELDGEDAPDGEPKWREILGDLQAHRPIRRVPIRMEDGDRSWELRLSARPFHDATGAFAGYRGQLVDVSRHLAYPHESITLEPEVVAGLIEPLPTVTLCFDAQDRVISANAVARAALGEDPVGRHRRELESDADAAETMLSEQTLRLQGPSGDGIWAQPTRLFWTNGERRFQCCHYVDVTATRRNLQQADEVERTEAVARFAASLAHDLANIVTIIGFATDTWRNGSREEGLEAAEDVEASVRLCAAITERLRRIALSAEQRTPTETDLVELATRAVRSVARRGGPRISVRRSATIDADGSLIAAVDEIDFERALFNLLTNAVQAMEGRSDARIDLHLDRLDGNAEIVIDDNGPGIPRTLRERVLQPLFTTKGESGSGLGLSQASTFCRRAGGRLEVDEAPSGGARIRMRFPLRTDRRAEPAGAEARTILIVDDEAPVRRSLARALRPEGWTLVEAGSAAEALSRLAQGLEADLVLSDVVMPGSLNGVQLMARIHRDHPRLPVLLMSGRIPEGLEKTERVLHKPLQIPKLVEELHRILDGTSEDLRPDAGGAR